MKDNAHFPLYHGARLCVTQGSLVGAPAEGDSSSRQILIDVALTSLSPLPNSTQQMRLLHYMACKMTLLGLYLNAQIETCCSLL